MNNIILQVAIINVNLFNNEFPQLQNYSTGENARRK